MLPSGAQVTLDADGSFTYDPSGQFDSLAMGDSDTDAFVYTIDDGNGGTASATVTIEIDGVNDPPVASNDNQVVAEGGTLTFPAPGVLVGDG